MKTIKMRAGGRLSLIANDPHRWIEARKRVFARHGATDLADVMQILGASATEMGHMMGVSRQAVDQWLESGVPVNRVATIGQIAQAARALRDYFRAERIPQIAREPIPGLDGRTILEVARTEPRRIVELIEQTRSYIAPGA